jgi:hypothetical protein
MLKFILFIFLVFVIGYQVLKLLFRPLLFFYSEKSRNSQFGRKENSRKDGELKVDFIPPKKSKGEPSGDGEYVDFEEIES